MKDSLVNDHIQQLVEVRWVDSCGAPGWHPKEDILDHITPALCVSYGVLKALRNSTAVVVATFSENEHWNDAMMIPCCAILSIRSIKV